MRPRVLIADDQPDILQALHMLLKGEFDVATASSPAEVLETLRKRDFDVVLTDLNYTRDTTSGAEGLDLLAEIGGIDDSVPVVVMTAWASIELAVEAMRRGARDFVEKPWDNSRLKTIVRTQAELASALRRSERLEAENRLLRGEEAPQLLAASPAMDQVLELIERVGPTDASVLLTGENGTGKGLVARVLHSASPRARRPMVTVNVAGLAESVFESELFGHVKGAFTDAKKDRVGRFELADGSTLFLDEIGNLTLGQQSKLLRVLETGEFERVGSSKTRRVDARIVSATNADLDARTKSGSFRQDLLFRLKMVEIRLPPLRERGEDVELLARHFFERHLAHYGKELEGLGADALAALGGHSWPGNVRELDHVVARGVLMARGRRVTADDLGLQPAAGTATELGELTLAEAERRLIEEALQQEGGSVSAAARRLGVSRSALYRRLAKYGSDSRSATEG